MFRLFPCRKHPSRDLIPVLHLSPASQLPTAVPIIDTLGILSITLSELMTLDCLLAVSSPPLAYLQPTT